MAATAFFIAGVLALATGTRGAAASYGDDDDLFNMTNRLHGYVDDSRLMMGQFLNLTKCQP